MLKPSPVTSSAPPGTSMVWASMHASHTRDNWRCSVPPLLPLLSRPVFLYRVVHIVAKSALLWWGLFTFLWHLFNMIVPFMCPDEHTLLIADSGSHKIRQLDLRYGTYLPIQFGVPSVPSQQNLAV